MVDPNEWDWTRVVVDHVDLHASDYAESVRFYETVLAALGIPRIAGSAGSTCFTNVNVVDRLPGTTGLHLCFHARSREQVDAFHRAGTGAGFRSNGAPGYRDYQPGYYAAYSSIPTATTSKLSIGTSAAPGTASGTGKGNTYSTLPRPTPDANLVSQVGALPAFDTVSAGRRLPVEVCWFYMDGAGRAQGRARPTLARIAPTDGLRVRDAELRGEGWCELELGLGRGGTARDHLRERFPATVRDVDLRVARQHRVSHAEAGRADAVSARPVQVLSRERRPVCGGKRLEPTSVRCRDRGR
jgi:catechol 2,3-dioxygenase-like lactoylglutathione lyase family enzyme